MPEEPVADLKYGFPKFTISPDELKIEEEYFVFHTNNAVTARNLFPKMKARFDLDGELLASWLNEIVITPTDIQDPVTMEASLSYGNLNTSSGSPRQVTPEENVATWTLEISTETVNVQEALKQTNWPERDTEYLTIGETADGSVEGVDILSPTSNLKIVHWLTQEAANAEFLDTIQKEVAAKVNKKEFKGPWGNWEAGEVLYLGASVSTVEGELLQLTHSFQRSVNGKIVIRFVENGEIQPPGEADKKGWQYFWNVIRSVKNPAGETKKTVTKPVSAHLADVYKEADYKALSLPPEFVGGSE